MRSLMLSQCKAANKNYGSSELFIQNCGKEFENHQNLDGADNWSTLFSATNSLCMLGTCNMVCTTYCMISRRQYEYIGEIPN